MLKKFSLVFILAAVSACSGSGSSSGGESTPTGNDIVYDLGVDIEGLDGKIEITNGGGGRISASEDGRIWFRGLAAGTNFSLMISAQPANQVCEIKNGAGVIGADIKVGSVLCSYETLWAGEQIVDRLGSAQDIDLTDDARILIGGYGASDLPFETAKIFSRYPNGVLQWTYVHDKVPAVIFDLTHDDEGFIYGVGHDQTNPNGIQEFGYKDAFIVKVNSKGQLVWDRSIGGAQIDLGYSVVTASIDRVYMAGITQSAIFEGNNTDRRSHVYVVALDALTGVTNWSYVKEASNLEGFPYVSLDSDKNLVLTYAAAQGGSDVNTQMLKLNSSGEVMWQREYGGNGKDIPERKAIFDSQGNIFLSGRTNSDSFLGQSSNGFNDTFLMKLSSSGDALWSRRFGDVNTQYYVGDVALGPNDEIILAVNDFGDPRRAVLFNWDNVGEKKWEKVIDSTRIVNVSGFVVNKEGYMFIIGHASFRQQYLLKLDPNGDVVK